MRKMYQICVDHPETSNVENALQHLGVKEFKQAVSQTHERDYIVSLSKYELLYLRLSCKTGTVKHIILNR